jgi:hypothetical protein
MSGTELRAHWRVALDAASAAVEAGRRAHTLSPQECKTELDRLHSEWQWLNRVQWP